LANPMTSPIETRISILTLTEDGILVASIKEQSEESYEDARENGAGLLKILDGGPPAPLLVDMRMAAGQSMEARKYYAEHAGQWSTKVALLVGSPVSRVMGNIYMGLNKPKVPTRMFTDEGKAYSWLRDA